MTKQLIHKRLPGGRINETDLGAIGFLIECPDGRAVVSRGELAEHLGCSAATLRSCIKRLERKQLLVVHERRHRNGGSLENEYCLTERAHEAYALALEAMEAWES